MSNAWDAMEAALDHPACQKCEDAAPEGLCGARLCGECHYYICEPDGCFGERQGDDDAGRWQRVCVQRTEEYRQFCHDVSVLLQFAGLYVSLGPKLIGLKEEAIDRERLLRTELQAREAFKS